MPRQRVVKTSFNAGEFSPRLYGRIDIDKYANGCKTMKNFLSMPHGGATRRPGFEYIASTKTASNSSRLIPFTYSTTQAYIIEAGPLYMRFYKDGGQIQTVDSDTKLLLHMEGTNNSTTITDDGDTTHTATATGNAKIATSEYKFTGSSAVFDGSGDYISVADHADFNFAADEFTIDTWIKLDTHSGQHCLFFQSDATATDFVIFYYDAETSKFVFSAMDAGVRIIHKELALPISASRWNHIALVRGWGGVTDDWALVVNGAFTATWTDSSTLPDHDGAILIGGTTKTTEVDRARTGHPITFAGNATLSTDASKFGNGSLYFDGTGDYISVPDHADWDISTNFTIDMFVKHSDHAGLECYMGQYTNDNNYWRFYHEHGNGLRFIIRDGGSNIVLTSSGGEITDTNWHHVALCKVGDEYGVYLDGTQVCYVSDASMATEAASLSIGGLASGNPFMGYINNVRVYDGNPFSATPNATPNDTITVPTAYHTSDSNTRLLIHGETKDVDGYIDEYRVSTTNRWEEAFTPPTTSYPAGDDSGVVYELVTAYTEAELSALRWVQSADTLYIVCSGREPYKLTRTAHDAWTITGFTYDTDNWPAFLDMNTTAITLDAAATTGTGIALVASAAFFDGTHVGAYFAMHSGYVKVTAVTDSTNAVVTVIDDLTAHTATADWYESAWSDYRGWPTCVTFYEDRLCFSGTSSNPDRIELSQSGEYENFKRGELDADDTAAASDGLSITLASRQVNVVKWLGSARKLLAGTTGAEWWIDGKDSSSAVDATELPRARNDSDYGSDSVAPVFIGNTVIFLQRLGSVVRAYSYDWETDQYQGRDMSIIAEHLTNFGTITGMAWQQTPHQIVWALRSDGVLLGLTYMREHKVEGWHWHEAAGTDAEIESIATIEGDSEDELWCIVKRTINSATTRYIERMAQLVQVDTGSGGSTDWTLEDAFFVDSGLTYRGAAVTEISGLDHLEGESVVALADGVVVTGLTVSSGAITLSTAASVVHIGLNYNSDLEPLWPIVQDNQGVAIGVAQRIAQLNLLLYKSAGGKYGPDSSNLVAIDYNEGDWDEGSSGNYYSGKTSELSVDGGYEGDPTPFVRQDEPLPLTVLAMIMEIEV